MILRYPFMHGYDIALDFLKIAKTLCIPVLANPLQRPMNVFGVSVFAQKGLLGSQASLYCTCNNSHLYRPQLCKINWVYLISVLMALEESA